MAVAGVEPMNGGEKWAHNSRWGGTTFGLCGRRRKASSCLSYYVDLFLKALRSALLSRTYALLR